MQEPFGARLTAALAARGPLCVGIDPHPGLLHEWGLDDTPDGLAHFAGTVVEALADRVAVLKPQSAFFERHGSRGIAVLERTLADGRAAGALMLLDAKRGDIGSTVAAYADAYLDPGSPLYADALTASPYLGFGSLDPLYAAARAGGSGVFVLAMTSNKEGPGVQLAALEDGRSVAQSIVDAAALENAGTVPLGDLGVVVGATTGDEPLDLSALNGPVLVPGFGAQGGTAADVRRLFPGVRGVLPSSSRGVLQYGPGLSALRDAAARDLDSLRGALS